MLPRFAMMHSLSAVLILQCSVACANPQAATAASPGTTHASQQLAAKSHQFDIASEQIGELSGITYAGEDQYYVVSDTNGSIAPLTIRIDPETASITQAQLGTPVRYEGLQDLEDIAFDASNASLWVCSEQDQSISRLSIDGQKIGAFTTRFTIAKTRPNLGLESLALTPSGSSLWTANEEALHTDGAVSSDTEGTVVRLQKMSKDGSSRQELFYVTDPHMGNKNLLKRAQSGVSGLVALPDGKLIVMERAFGGHAIPAFRIRLYLVDTNVTATGDGTPAKVEKKRLAEIQSARANYEGITLGPKLANGDHALVLVSDNGGSSLATQRLMVVRLPQALIDAGMTEQ